MPLWKIIVPLIVIVFTILGLVAWLLSMIDGIGIAHDLGRFFGHIVEGYESTKDLQE